MMRRIVDQNGTQSVPTSTSTGGPTGGPSSSGSGTTHNNVNVNHVLRQFSTTSDLNLNLQLSPSITAVSSETSSSELLHGTNLSTSNSSGSGSGSLGFSGGGGSSRDNFNSGPIISRPHLSPPLYRLLPHSQQSVNRQTTSILASSSVSGSGSGLTSTPALTSASNPFVDTQDNSHTHTNSHNSHFAIPSLLSISTNAFSSSSVSTNTSTGTFTGTSTGAFTGGSTGGGTGTGTRLNFNSPSSLLQSSNNRSFMSSRSNNVSPPLLNANMDTNMNMNSQSQSQSRSSPPGIILNELRTRSRTRDEVSFTRATSPPVSPVMKRGRAHKQHQKKQQQQQLNVDKEKEALIEKATRRRAICNEMGKNARRENDSMVYLDGPRIYTCGECRTHLTSHDEIISKSFHGRHGRAYLFDQCVNITIGPAEDRRLITGLHSVCDIFCKRCKTLIGWTYTRAYDASQKYKEGKFIIEKIHLHMEESDCYKINLPAGEKRDRWRIRSMSWSSENSANNHNHNHHHNSVTASPHRRGSGVNSTIYEYRTRTASWTSPKGRSRSISTGGVSSIGSPPLSPAFARPPSPPHL